MKRVILAFLFMFLIFGMLFGSAIVKAEENNSTTSNSGTNSGSSDLRVTDNSGSDDSGNTEDVLGATDDSEDELEVENETDEGDRIRERIRNQSNVRKEFSKTITTEDGTIIKIERKVEIKNGEVKIKIKKTITFADGTKTTIEIEIERNEKGVSREIQIEGENVSISKEIEINDLFEGNESELEAVLSNGNKTKIKVLPEQASEIARERLKAKNISNFTLEEIRHKNIPRVVYKVETNQNGRFLGVFKLAMKSNTQIDPETGEILEVNKPWWAFLVSIPEEETFSGNETVNQTNP